MEASIFGKPLLSVEYDDVIAFCAQKVKENLVIDYKGDLSNISSVVKTHVSFANTNGGWIIIGVNDKDDMPKEPVEGIKHEDNFIERINSTIIATVNPIVLPEYKVATKNGKSFIILYTTQSPTAPHWYSYKDKKNALLIRVADKTKSADWEQDAPDYIWERLRNNRNASAKLAENLLDEQLRIFDTVAYQDDKANQTSMMSMLSSHTPGDLYHYARGAQIVRVSPTFPSSPIVDVPETQDAVTNDRIDNILKVRHPSTPDVRESGAYYQNGFYYFYPDARTEGDNFFVLDVYGCITSIDPIERHRVIESIGEHFFVEYVEIISHIDGVLRFASAFYTKNSLAGNIDISVDFNGRDFTDYLYFSYDQMPYSRDKLPINVRGTYTVERTTDSNILSDDEARAVLIFGIVKEIFYSFNYPDFDEEAILKIIKRTR